MSGTPPPAGAPTPAAPAKVPMKLAAKIPMGNISVKLPVNAAGAPPAALLSKFVSVLPTRVALPNVSAPVKSVLPKPAAVAVAKPAPPKPAAAPVKRPRIEDDEDDDLNALGVARSVIPRPSPQAAKKPVARTAAPVKRAPVKEESSSDSESEQDEESVSLFARASQKGIVPVNDPSILEEEEEVVVPGVPPRPPIQKSFGDIDGMIDRLNKKIATEEAKLRIKDDNKTISLSTSKVNYIDPRIVCAWCKRENVPISRVFAASLQKKFPWALNTEATYEF